MGPLPSNIKELAWDRGSGMGVEVSMWSQKTELEPEMESEGSREGHREATPGSE